jgi:flagellar hook-length control protein FliK
MQISSQNDATSAIKQSKLSSPTYLFSNIIKLIHENTIGETSVNSNIDGIGLADVSTMNAGSTEPLGQLLTLVNEKPVTEDINISLNNLLKNLLVTSQSEQAKNPKQIENTSKKSTTQEKLTSILSKPEVKNLLQSLASALLQLNISPDSLKQIQTGNTNLNSTNQDSKDLLQLINSSNQSGNNVVELVINLSNGSDLNDSLKLNSSNQTSSLTSLYAALSSILSNPAVNITPQNKEKTASADSETASTGSKTTSAKPAALQDLEQLTNALINLYQVNNNVVINFNSGNENIKFEIANEAPAPADKSQAVETVNTSGSANTASTDNTKGIANTFGADGVLNSQNKNIGTDNTNQQATPDKTYSPSQKGSINKDATIAATVVNKVKNSFDLNSEAAKPSVLSAQTSPKIVSDKNVTIVPDEIKNVIPTDKSDLIDAANINSEDKVTVTVISKLNNTQPVNTGIESTDVKTADVKVADTYNTYNIKGLTAGADSIPLAKSDTNNVQISTENIPALANNNIEKGSSTVVQLDNEPKIPIKFEAQVNDKTDVKAPDNSDNKVSSKSKAKLSAIDDVKVSDKKIADNTGDIKIKSNSVSGVKNTAKNIAKTQGHNVETPDADNTAELNISNTPKGITKEIPDSFSLKSNQVGQTSVATNQNINASENLTSGTVPVKQAGTQEAAQIIDNKQGNSFNDQPQKKSADNSKNSDNKSVEQVSTDFSAKITDSVKEKFINPVSLKDIPEKTIRITEITKEISSIIQQNNSKTVVLQLRPESLGKIKVTVDVNNNSVIARVEVDTEAVRQIVQNNTSELRQSLNLNGMQLSSMSVNVSGGGEQKPYQPNAQKKKSGYHSSDKRIEDNASLASAKSLGYNTYEYLI